MFQIKYGKYLLTAVRPDQYPALALPAITLLGRSNVGKSSLINTLANHRGLARTSSQPGKTRTINFYEMDSAWYLVDLPGYGYAKVAKTERQQWEKMIGLYFEQYSGDSYYWQLVDIRHPPSQLDIAMCQLLKQRGERFRVIATKADKISRGAREKHIRQICNTLQVPRELVLAFSAVSKDGKAALLAEIAGFLAAVQTKMPE